MTVTAPHASVALAREADWQPALSTLLESLAEPNPNALLLFASEHHAEHMPEVVHAAWQRTGTPLLLGCSGAGIIAGDQEVERAPALAALALQLPGARLTTARFGPELIADDEALDPQAFARRIGVTPEDAKGWLLFADPFRTDGERLLAALTTAYPESAVVGGFASPGPHDRRTALFLNGQLYPDGGVGLAIGGAYEVLPVVAQGCEPIGEAWTITGAQASWIETISNRPAIQVLAETLHALPEDLRERAQRNLVIGIAVDEYRSEFNRGDFLIRNLVGIDQATGAIAVAALPRVGQTVQFQIRDAATADLDLAAHLDEARHRLGRRSPVAGLLCACNGRGVNLFGQPHHDAAAVARKFAGLPLAGLFCAGEIGPVGGRHAIHGFTASLGLIVPKA